MQGVDQELFDHLLSSVLFSDCFASAKQIHDLTSPPIQTIKATSQLGDPRVTYNLEDGMVPETNMPVRFYLSPNREDGSASILVSEPLDYETTPVFSLRVRAQNVAAVPLAAFTTVYVNITGQLYYFYL